MIIPDNVLIIIASEWRCPGTKHGDNLVKLSFLSTQISAERGRENHGRPQGFFQQPALVPVKARARTYGHGFGTGLRVYGHDGFPWCDVFG
jgi:hypothetical protein